MKTTSSYAMPVGLLTVLLTFNAFAKVSEQEANQLKTELTPVGAVRAGNPDGSIPAWTGGLTEVPACYKGEGSRYCDPFPEDKPLFTISEANLVQYKERLSGGQLAMFQKYPQTYKIKVYPSRRTFATRDFVYDATYRNALNAELGGDGEALVNAVTGYPFPIPKSGYEPIWNHKVRYRGVGASRWNAQAAVTTTGDFNIGKLQEDAEFFYSHRGMTPERLNNTLTYFLQSVTQPPRLAGTITLVHETMDQVKEQRRAWQYNPGQRRLRRAPNVAYDNPGTASDGLRTNDQFDVFNGAMDRYSWKIVGKREIYIPANSYVLHSDQYKYKDLLQAGHINQDLARYELRRVWVVDAEIKPGMYHLYQHRVFYVDEDSWQIVLADCYDRQGQLWRWQEAHTIEYYDKRFSIPVLETVYDLESSRYLALAMNNEEPENVEKEFPLDYFSPGNLQKKTTK